MYYIFNQIGELIATCSSMPDVNDLNSRKEVAIESDITFKNPRLHNNAILELGTPPSDFHKYDFDLHEWTITPDDLKRLQAKEIDELINNQRTFVVNHLNNKAIERGYLSIADAISYADEPAVSQFQREGQAFRAWRSLVWERINEYFDNLKTESTAILSNDELLNMLPKLNLD